MKDMQRIRIRPKFPAVTITQGYKEGMGPDKLLCIFDPLEFSAKWPAEYNV